MNTLAGLTNPHKKGTMEYLDWVTAQHNKATAKPKAASKKANPKEGLAGIGVIKMKQKKELDSYNSFMGSGTRVKR